MFKQSPPSFIFVGLTPAERVRVAACRAAALAAGAARTFGRVVLRSEREWGDADALPLGETRERRVPVASTVAARYDRAGG